MATGTIKKGMVKLWTNPAPSSQFSAQTVEVDLTGYDLAFIEYAQNNANDDYYYSFIYRIDGKIHMAIGFSSGRMTRRFATTKSSEIVFTNGEIANSYASGFASDNQQLIPINIYGIIE